MATDPAAISPYTDGLQHLSDELRLLDMRIRALLERPAAHGRFAGLAVTSEEISELMSRPGPFDSPFGAETGATEFDGRIAVAAQAATTAGVFLPLPELGVRLGLTRLEERLLV